MTLEIISPTGIRGIAVANSASEKAYFEKWKERGYQVREMVIHRRQLEECEACSA